ncbi:MAG: anti-sigma factor family protein, partial [Actinomycetota bacterium]
MQCQAVLKRLNLVVDGERLPGLGAYAETCLHCARCVRCRAAWAMLRGQRRLCRALPVGAVPSELRARVLSSLPPMEPAMPGARRRTARRGWLAGAAAVGALAVIGGGTLLSGTGSQVLASDVGASISRARSWHLVGWRKVGDRQQSWEVWGRRAPYLYREQSGDDLLVDNGATRLQTFSKGNGKVLAVRMPSQRTPESARWTRLTVGQNWSREEPWSVTRDTLIFRWTDSGMQGPGSVAHDYFFVDRRTKLPRRWEYRHVKGEREEVVEMMTAEYNVAPPPAASLAAPPPGSTVVDAMGATGSLPPGENAQSAGGVTAQLIPVKAAPDGTVLIRLRSWLGNARMDLQGGPLFTSIAHPIWARTIDGKAHPWPVKDELGRPYVWVHDLRNGS